MQLAREGPVEEAAPDRGADADHAAERPLGLAEAHGADQAGEPVQRVAHRGLAAGVHGGHQEHGGLRGRGEDGLRGDHVTPGGTRMLIKGMKRT
ncbi:hypothetical protein GCM10019017_18230 [Streptomyces showdoensis]